METTSGSRNMLENVSPSVLVLLFLTTLIAGGIIFLIRYAVSRRSRSSLEQDSSKSLEYSPSWSPTAPPLSFIPQEPACYSHSFRNGRRIPLNKRRNKQLTPTHSWLTATLRGHTGFISDMSFSNNGRYLASCADGM
ncbi:transducin beta-like protein 2 [Formica exsecta]|uniref:transducin beta-like protein 2 n=1 Tax=Formica exsecta TaxID=72781 RepID=UPI001141961D|nr:transducin beta-like protein 2 [Formica exsecta]